MTNCSICGAQISSPKLTGELCAKCYFKSKNNQVVISEALVNTETIIDAPVGPSIQESIQSIQEQSSIESPITIDSDYDLKKEHHPGINNSRDVINHNSNSTNSKIKYCQSCIERGYGLKIATRELRKGEFICDDCFGPMLENDLGYSVTRAIIERVIPQVDNDKPLLEQFYNLLEIPEQLRFTKSEQILTERNQIFNYHAQALVNKSQEEVLNWIEQLQVMLFQIKVSLEPNVNYINKVKAEAREKANLEGIKKSKAIITKGPSKTKVSQDEKMAKVLGMTLEKYQEMAKAAKTKEFDKIIDGK
jgi:hypothetical protein